MFRPKSLFNRYIRSHFITSQHKLNKLWKPPRMPVGRLYANVVKDVSLCIVYGPIFPLAYLLTAVRLALSFWTNLFTITYFFGRPATLAPNPNPNPNLHPQTTDPDPHPNQAS